VISEAPAASLQSRGKPSLCARSKPHNTDFAPSEKLQGAGDEAGELWLDDCCRCLRLGPTIIPRPQLYKLYWSRNAHGGSGYDNVELKGSASLFCLRLMVTHFLFMAEVKGSVNC